jgi:hypothetical protein
VTAELVVGCTLYRGKLQEQARKRPGEFGRMDIYEIETVCLSKPGFVRVASSLEM